MMGAIETLYHEVELLDEGIIPKPRMAIVYPTYKCNQNCYYCFYKELNNGKTATKEMLFNILKQLEKLGVKGIELCGGGEPLLMPEPVEFFHQANNLGFKLGLLTNGTLFSGKIAEEFLKIGTYVRFSVDTIDNELYKKIRGSDKLNEVLNNIFQALALKKKHNYQCDISVKVGMAREIGTEQMQEMYKYFQGWGLNTIQIKNLWSRNGEYYNKNVNKNTLGKLDDRDTIVIRKVKYPKYMESSCWLSPVQVTIDALGDVYACCYYMFREATHKIGNLFETPLEKLWGSEKHKEVIRNLKVNECLKHDCRFQKYMRAIRKQQKKGDWAFI